MDQFRERSESPDLAATWSVLDREPGMDDLAEGITDLLADMGTELGIFAFQDTDGNDRLFLMRYEFPKYQEQFTFPEAAKEDTAAFLDMLAGFPIDCVEMLLLLGEFTSKAKEDENSKVNVQPGTGVTPPVPSGDSHFFKWPEEDKILLNLTAIVTKNVGKIFAKNLDGEPKPANVKWWFRTWLSKGTEATPQKYPIIGEFLCLGVRMFPGMYWGHQKSSPFIYSGNYFDSVYLTGGRITEVIPPETEDAEVAGKFPWNTYKVKWRKSDSADSEGIVENVIPSDFAEYRGKIDDQPGDRVSILKDVGTEKKTQLWKDEDQRTWGTNWQIIPLTFYGGI